VKPCVLFAIVHMCMPVKPVC